MKLNEDKELVALIKEGLKKRDGHCPCEVQMTPETKCPCAAMRERDECRCGLFVDQEK